MTGTLRDWRIESVALLKWYGAPSQTKTLSFLHYGRSLSSFFTSSFKKILIILLLLFDCVKLKYKFPSVSIAISIETLGIIFSVGTELVVSFAHHFILRKSIIPNQVSSAWIITFLLFERPRKAIAHLCLNNRFRGVLALFAIFLIFLNLISRCSFIT